MAAMTFIVVSIAVRGVQDVPIALDRARQAVGDGARLVEWRLDELAEEEGALRAAERLLRESPAPSIVTIRPENEGGQYAGPDDERISLLEALATGEYPPRYIDIELETIQRSMNVRQKVMLAVQHGRQVRDLHTALIVSSHDFRQRPADLLQRIEAMTNEAAASVVKIVWQARSLRDNLEAFDLLRERRKPMAAFCMGSMGLMSRVLAPKFGGLFTYAGDIPTEVTAPGQLMVRELRERYRFDSIGSGTNVYGVIGWPVAHSLGPAIHNAGFDAVGHDGVYLPLPVPPEYEHFKATVGSLVDHAPLDFRGASVTIPHKTNLVCFVRERGGVIEALAEKIGAANTLVVRENGVLEARNTDAPAAVEALCAGMGIELGELRSKRIAVLGAGGVARAVVWGLARLGAHVVVFNRTQERAAELAAAFAGRPLSGESNGAAKVEAGRGSDLGCGCFHAIVNCTSIGMKRLDGDEENGSDQSSESPLDVLADGAEVQLDENVTVMDTVYTPRATPLIVEARERGARIVTGDAMFFRQAAMQFELWTGKEAPVALWRKDLTERSG